ncbi:MAG: hypothetical protein GY927_01620 [bacterium]|nr:hypothetical protein [bacterium]
MDISTVIKSFKKENIVTVALLMTWLSCSMPTARRRLKEWGAYTSYNHNGRYYTLPEIPKFNKHGLWQYRGVFFSKHGNLKQTVVHLVTHSEQGLSGSELGELLGLQPRSFLSHFRTHPGLYRERLMGRWIWFAADQESRKQQRQTRLDRVATQAHRMPSDMESVMILVDLINHPNSSLERIASRLKRKGIDADVEAIRKLLAHHDLLKKNMVFPSSAT